MFFGQFTFVLLLLIALAWKTSRMKKDRLAGVILGLATGLKLFMGIFFILFLVYRRWRLLFYFIGTYLLFNIISLVVFKFATFKKFLSLLQKMPWYAESWNASFMGFFTRIFGGSLNIPLVNQPWLAQALSLLLSLALIGSLIRYAWPSAGPIATHRFDLLFSLALVEMLLISPYGWLYYFPVLILPAVVAWRASENCLRSRGYKLLIVIAWALSTIPTPLIWAEDARMNQPIIWFTSAGIYFYALLIMSAVFITLLHKTNSTGWEMARMLK